MKTIKLKAKTLDDFGIQLSVDGRIITSHFEADTAKALAKLLRVFGISDDEFKIEDER